MKKYLKLVRLNQWSKNFLIFIPIIVAKKYEIIYFQNGLLGFIIFSLLASSVYIFNDIVDFNKDKEQEMLSKLSNAKIPIDSFQLPVIDKNGTIFTNGSNFIAFLKKLLE